MKKAIIFHILFLILFLLVSRPVFAGSQNKPEEVEEKDISKITIDESREVPLFKLVPPPTPTPVSKEEKPADKRSWTKSPHQKLIAETAKKYSLDPQIIYATIMTESDGREYAFRYEPKIKDASLCMGQILISTARSLGFSGNPKELYKPEICIDLIGKYHRKMLSTYGELTPIQLATAYNAGSPWKRPVPGHLYRFQKWFNES
jgi:soluble lytic murein transglycosylase-like protein